MRRAAGVCISGSYPLGWALSDFAEQATRLDNETLVVVGAHDQGVPEPFVRETWLRSFERHHRMQPCRRSSRAKPERSWASGPAPSNGSRHLDWSKQNWAQQRHQPGETAVKMAPAEVAVGLHVSDHRLDCRATPQFALDGAPALRKPPSPALDPERAWETTERS